MHYAAQGVMSVSLNRDGVRLPMSLHHNGSHHPTRAGHAEIARLIERAIMERSRSALSHLAKAPTAATPHASVGDRTRPVELQSLM